MYDRAWRPFEGFGTSEAQGIGEHYFKMKNSFGQPAMEEQKNSWSSSKCCSQAFF